MLNIIRIIFSFRIQQGCDCATFTHLAQKTTEKLCKATDQMVDIYLVSKENHFTVMWICDCFNNKTNTTASNTFHPESAEFALGVGLQRLGMSKPTPPQRVTRALTWLLFTETCLWAIQTHQILKARSFRFTHCEGGGDGTVADRRGGGQTGGAAEGKSQRTVGLRGNKKTSGTLGGGHMSSDGGREGGTGREHPKVRRGQSECFAPEQVLILSVTVEVRAGVICRRLDWLITFSSGG